MLQSIFLLHLTCGLSPIKLSFVDPKPNKLSLINQNNKPNIFSLSFINNNNNNE
jgi:hypothetical protein